MSARTRPPGPLNPTQPIEHDRERTTNPVFPCGIPITLRERVPTSLPSLPSANPSCDDPWMLVERQVELRFDVPSREAATHTNLSAVRTDALGLWLAGDETATIEHLTLRDGRYDDQRTFFLADFVDLPAGRTRRPTSRAWADPTAGSGRWGRTASSAGGSRRSTPAQKARRRLGSRGARGEPLHPRTAAARRRHPRPRGRPAQGGDPVGPRPEPGRPDGGRPAPRPLRLDSRARTTAWTSRASPCSEAACSSACAARCCAAGP